MKNKALHTRKDRRRQKARVKPGKGGKPARSHQRIAGRTGSIRKKQTPSSKPVKLKRTIPNKPTFWPKL